MNSTVAQEKKPTRRYKPAIHPNSYCTVVGWLGLALSLLLCGCATSHKLCPTTARKFDFRTDTFDYSNQLTWEYTFQTNGAWTAHQRVPAPDYALHCFVMARAAERFFFNARFDATRPVSDLAVYRRLIHATLTGDQPQSFPGYANLREFSRAQENLLKEECGGAWRCYLQRGNWRMIFPFSRAHQAGTAEALQAALAKGELPLVHLARFPQQTINHCVLLYAAKDSPEGIRFQAYDANIPDAPQTLTYDRETRTFTWPRSHYFGGGRVDVYRIYHRWNY